MQRHGFGGGFGLKIIELKDAGRVHVWADLHLQEEIPAETEAFALELEVRVQGPGTLVIAGDLFNAWTGRGQWEWPVFQPLALALGALKMKGVRVILLRGNRDVLLEPVDGEGVGAEVADGVVFSAGERRILLTHGDEYCLNDKPYQRLRHFLRALPARWALRSLPGFVRRAIARSLRKTSQAAIARKPLDSMALVEDCVRTALHECEADWALIGHLHRAEERDLGKGRKLEVLPAWEPGTLPWTTVD
jgi:UDP-2,3-diacylglucosamine hydrolase